jgi:hypothetical protein
LSTNKKKKQTKYKKQGNLFNNTVKGKAIPATGSGGP